MHWKARGWTLIGMLLVALPGAMKMAMLSVSAQMSGTVPGIGTSTVTDTVYRADGSAATGTVIVSWQAFTTANGQSVPSGSTSTVIGADGAMSVSLAPNAGSTPMGSYYTAVYHLDDGSVSREFWVVPVSQTPVLVSAIKTTVLPTSVAMQTVSKSYVDTAIAAAVSGHPLDSSTPYVLKTGDAMTGPLVLPGDPATPTQAADKHYVDTTITALTSGLGQKVALLPTATQTVVQPAGTQLQVNSLNGVEYAAQYVTGLGNNGIANSVTSTDCASGCDVKVDRGYGPTELYRPWQWNSSIAAGTHVQDSRDGQQRDSYLNPKSVLQDNADAGQVIDVASTRNFANDLAAGGVGEPNSFGMVINHEGMTGGSNLFPQNIEGVPYFKSNYSALVLNGNYNAMGQHVLEPHAINCYGVGDCLGGSQFITVSGGIRDEADEGAHPADVQIQEDPIVFQGTCSAGCTTGSTAVTIAVTSGPGTQGEGRFLIDKNPAKVITTGMLTGGTGAPGGTPGAQAGFSGTNFPVSVFLATGQSALSQARNMAPGTVTMPIATSGVPAGFATNTAAISNPSGVACIAEPNSIGVTEFEMVNYAVVDGTHLQLALNKVHRAGATVAIGGLCGYGLEETVDTTGGIRQVFPVLGSYSATGLYYAGGSTAIVGVIGNTGGFLNVNLQVASIARSNNVVTVTTAGNMPVDLNGLTMQIAGVVDPSYNGSYTVTTTGANALTYADAGANSTSSGGTVAIVTGGYALYPMAEVLGVFNATTKSIDGQMTLAPNTVQWASNDVVEQPHYFEERVSADTTFVRQTVPRPTVRQAAGVQYLDNVGTGLTGWVVDNAAPVTNYFGHGGTHGVPAFAYEARGIWTRTMDVQAGEESAFAIHCNSHGCGKWNSGYNVFLLDSNVGADSIFFQPTTSTLTVGMRGTAYSFSPQAFTVGTINAGTINATTLNGAVSAVQLPVFGASGSGHAKGAVPDPGTTAGTAHYLREDGTWAVPTGSGLGVASPENMPRRANLLGEYLLNEGSGTVADDTSGLGNNGIISGATWEGKADLNFGATGEFIQLPTALNQTNTFQFAIYAPPYNYGSFGANPSLLCGTDTSHTCLVENSYLASVSQRFYEFNSSHTESQEFLTAGWHIVTFVNGVGSDKDHWYYDGAEVNGYVAQGSGGILHPASGNYQIGGSTAYTGTWWLGKVAAAWAWSTPLSMTDVAAASKSAMDYIQTKGAAMPVRTAVSASPLVIGGIDSRTFGAAVTTPWINSLALSDSSYTSLDLGISGIGAIDANAMFGTIYAPHISKDSPDTIVVLWGGVNDMSGADKTQLIAASLKGMVQKAKALGARVILATEIDSSGNDARKNALNAVIRSKAFSWGVDSIADLATIPQLGADGAASNATYFTGGLHPVDAGEVFITAVMSDAVNELIGSTETNRHTTAAATYQEVAGDRFLDLTGTAAQAVSLPDCVGYSLNRQVVNLGSVAGTVAAINGETLTGSASITVGARAVFVPVPGAQATGGCRWERTQ